MGLLIPDLAGLICVIALIGIAGINTLHIKLTVTDLICQSVKAAFRSSLISVSITGLRSIANKYIGHSGKQRVGEQS